MYTNRRNLILGASALALTGPALGQDLSKLNDPSPIGEMSMGPADAKVTIIEYASASCPHCANFYKTTFQDLKKDYIDAGKVRFIVREFPHNDAGLAGFMIARCAPPDKYFPVLGMIYEQQAARRIVQDRAACRHVEGSLRCLPQERDGGKGHPGRSQARRGFRRGFHSDIFRQWQTLQRRVDHRGIQKDY